MTLRIHNVPVSSPYTEWFQT